MLQYAKHFLALLATLCVGFYLGGYWVANMVKSNSGLLFKPTWLVVVNNILVIGLVCGIVCAGVWVKVDYMEHNE